MSVTKKIGSSIPIAILGGRAKSKIGTLKEPIAPPKPDLETETASTEIIAKIQKYSEEFTITSKPFIDDIFTIFIGYELYFV